MFGKFGARIGVADPDNSAAFGSKQGLHDDVASQSLKGHHGIVFVFANNRLGNRQSGRL